MLFLVIFFRLVLQVLASDSPESKVESRVKQTFPKAQKIRVYHIGNTFSAYFILNVQKVEIEYNEKLKEMSRKFYLKKDELPKAITADIEREFPEGILMQHVKVVKDGKTHYQITLEENDFEYELIYAPDGKLIRQKKKLAETEQDMGC